MVNVEKTLLQDLLDYKIRSLNEEIQNILSRWNANQASKFLEDARNGNIKNAEMDAILLRQLMHDRDLLEKKKIEYKVA
jgi:hypothetical protein